MAVGAIVIFFCLQYPNNGGFNLDWWGNTVHENTLDGQGAAPFAVEVKDAQKPFGLTTVRFPSLAVKTLTEPYHSGVDGAMC